MLRCFKTPCLPPSLHSSIGIAALRKKKANLPNVVRFHIMVVVSIQK